MLDEALLRPRQRIVDANGYLVWVVGAVLLSLVALIQPFGSSLDFENYRRYFNLARLAGLDGAFSYRFEPGFAAVVTLFTKAFSDDYLVYAALVGLSMMVKAMFVKDMAMGRYAAWVLLVFYVFRYFALHEMTQIRAAISAGFLLIFAVKNQRKDADSIVYAVLAVSFHYSSLVCIIFWLLGSGNWKRYVITLVAAAVCIVVLLNPVIWYLLPYFKVGVMYERMGLDVGGRNLLNPSIFLDMLMVLYMVANWAKLNILTKKAITVIGLGIVVYYCATDSLAFAHRVRELTSVFWLVALSSELSRADMRRSVALAFVALSGVGTTFANFFGSRVLFY